MRVARVAPVVVVVGALAVAVAGAGACGDNLRPTFDGVRGGDRLKATFVAADDARLFTGFYDRERGERCRFELLPDGERALCMSTTTPTTATEFADAWCTLPLAPALPVESGERPRFARLDSVDCEPPVLWQLGDPVELTEYYTRTSSGSCTWRPGNPRQRWYPAIAPVPLDVLVEGRAHVEDGDGPLQVRYVDGADGSRQPVGVYDQRMAAPCRFTDRVAFDTVVELGCYPDLCASGTGDFLDESCRPLATAFGDVPGNLSPCDCTARRFALVWPAGDPSPTARLPEIRELGPELTPPIQLYAPFEETCSYTGFTPEPATSTRDRIEPVLATRAFVPGAGRIRSIVIAGAGASVVEPWLRDTELALDCRPLLARDGVVRCLPSGISQLSDSFFADEACTQPVRVAIDEELDAPARWAIVDDRWRTVYQLAREALPGTLFTGGPGIGCARQFWPREFQRFYVVGPEAAPERFAEMVEITE